MSRLMAASVCITRKYLLPSTPHQPRHMHGEIQAACPEWIGEHLVRRSIQFAQAVATLYYT